MSDVTLNRHLHQSGMALVKAAEYCNEAASDCFRDLLDSPESRDYARARIAEAEHHLAAALHRLNLYSAGEATKAEAVDGAVDRLAVALSGKCPDCGEPTAGGGMFHEGCHITQSGGKVDVKP